MSECEYYKPYIKNKARVKSLCFIILIKFLRACQWFPLFL